jgi:uncharacterized protein DUF4168
MTKVGLFAAALLAAGLVSAPFAYAKTPSATGPATVADTPDPADIPDSKLDAAAAAVKQVAMVKETFEAKLAKAPENEKESVVEEANLAAEKAVNQNGLSVKEFITIMDAAESNPAVRAKIIQRLK